MINVGDLRFTVIDRLPTGASRTGGALQDAAVLCLHGFPYSPATFRHQKAALSAAGYRVIVPTMRGYEPSSQSEAGDYSLMSLAGDVVGWLDALNLDRVHLVGHDWGAVAGYVAAAHHPDRFHTLTTLAIPPLARIPDAVRRVLRQLLRSWYVTFFQLPVVAERALGAGNWRLLRRLWSTWSPGYTQGSDEWDALRAQFEAPGVVPATLGYYRQNATPPVLLGLQSTPAMQRSVIDVPTLILYGADDGCMDRRLFEHTVFEHDFPAGVDVRELPGVGHFLHLEQPQQINELLISHLASTG